MEQTCSSSTPLAIHTPLSLAHQTSEAQRERGFLGSGAAGTDRLRACVICLLLGWLIVPKRDMVFRPRLCSRSLHVSQSGPWLPTAYFGVSKLCGCVFCQSREIVAQLVGSGRWVTRCPVGQVSDRISAASGKECNPSRWRTNLI